MRQDLGKEIGLGQNWARWSGWVKNLAQSGRGSRGRLVDGCGFNNLIKEECGQK